MAGGRPRAKRGVRTQDTDFILACSVNGYTKFVWVVSANLSLHTTSVYTNRQVQVDETVHLITIL